MFLLMGGHGICGIGGGGICGGGGTENGGGGLAGVEYINL